MGLLDLCLGNLKNLGVSSCKKLPNLVKGMITTPEDFSIPIASANDLATWQDALLAAPGVRIYFWPIAVMVENINEEAVYEETALSTMSVRDGRYRWRLQFQENLQYHKAMFSHSGFNGRVFLLDDKNQITCTSDDGLSLKGFSLDLLNVEKLLFNDGAAATKTPVYLSLEDNLELDENGCMFDGSFTKSLTRLTTVNIEVLASPAPSASGFDVKITSDLDGGPLSGLDVADFVFTDVLGVAQTLTGSTESTSEPGRYSLAGTTLVSGNIDLVIAASLSIPGFESSGPAEVTI